MVDSKKTSKVSRLIETYDLGDIGREIEHRWTREQDRWSLRQLADWFNKQLLKQATADVGMRSIDNEIDTTYELLTDDDVSEGSRVQVRRQLEQAGIDIETLIDEFVTYQAIRTYVKDVRNAEYEQPTTTPNVVLERIQRLAGRTVNVGESQIEQLRSNGAVDVDEFRLLVDIQLYCEECNTQFEIAEFLHRGACNCSDPDE